MRAAILVQGPHVMKPLRSTTWKIRLCALPAILAAGCAQNGQLISRPSTVGALKSSLSRMEYENEQLRKDLARSKVDVRDLEDRLAQEESRNGDLSARLDDARNVLSRRGDGALSAAGDDGSRTLPAGRPTRKARKAPVAEIRGASSRDDDLFDNAPADDDVKDMRGLELRPQSRRDDNVWLPIQR